MSYSVGLLLSGSELLDARVEDCNSYPTVRALSELGLQVEQVVFCKDDKQALLNAMRFLLSQAKILIISGGLGPTSDDLTRETVAEFAGLALELNEASLRKIKQLLQQRKRRFEASNEKQAWFPKGSLVIDNPRGTAPGFCLSTSGYHIIALPGVPWELEPMLKESVLPLIRDKICGGNLSAPPSRVLRVFGLPEAEVGTQVKEVLKSYDDILPSFCANFPEVEIVLKPKESLKLSQDRLSEAAEEIKTALGKDYVFSESAACSLEHCVHKLLIDRQLTLSLAESCTGGLLGSLLTSNSGSSAYFLGGLISYSNQLKIAELGVPEDLINSDGAVSFKVAGAMAQGARRKFKSDICMSITGIAGPDGGFDSKPVGTFFVGYCDGGSCVAYQHYFLSSRGMIQRYAAYSALDILRRSILGLKVLQSVE